MQMVLRFFIAGVLMAAGGSKLLDLPGFVLVLRSYGVFAKGLLWPAALAVTVVELALAIWLILGRQLARGAAASILLHAIYACWGVFMLLRGEPILNCGCFGTFMVRPLSWTTVIEDLALMIISVSLFMLTRRPAAR